MTIRLQEVVRSEVEGGLFGPANPIPSQSLDCGCGQLPCPKLARFATRRLFVGLISWVGFIQAAAYAYINIAGPTIARRFQFDPYIMEWVLVISDLTPFALGILIAYWGDRIHRVAWIGSVVLIQSVAYFVMIIPHLTHQTKVVEETENVTHLSLYTEDSRELCSETSSRIIGREDQPCYFTFGVLAAVQIINGIGNIVYFTLGISYLDDNTRKRNVAAFIGVVIAVKVIGVLLGCILAWICLRIDAVTLNPVKSYKEQIGAWWLGLPIFTVLLVVPGVLLSWFPRALPSKVVEQAAASLLKNSNRGPRRLISQKVGSPNFWPSLGRLVANKILICQSLAASLYATAIIHSMNYENLIAQSRFHVPKPTGTLLGFDDPASSRLILNIVKPLLIGLVVIISGFVIAKVRPNARGMVAYSIVVILLACGIIFAITAASCEKKPIVGSIKKSLALLQYCNRNCGCSNDADFRPVCDRRGMYTFYSACHAGCTASEIRNGIATYSGCSCVEEMSGSGNTEAIGGPCVSNDCQISRLIFEFGTLLAYILVALTFVADLLIILRSVNAQDKAIGIGFWMTCSAVIVNVPGKLLYETIANLTCQFWGTQRVACHLHDGAKLGNYLCYVTATLLALSAVVKVLLWFLSGDMNLYVEHEEETASGTEMLELIRDPAPTAAQNAERTDTSNDNTTPIHVEVPSEVVAGSIDSTNEPPSNEEESKQSTEAPLKYGPLGPGDRRTTSKSSPADVSRKQKLNTRSFDSEDELSSSDEEQRKDSSPKVAYRPLDIDSDVESELSNVGPRSRKRVVSKDYDSVYNSGESSSARSSLPKREFPNPDDYEDPRLSRGTRYRDPIGHILQDGSSKTGSFKFSRKSQDNVARKIGDFNEVGIPIVDSSVEKSSLKSVKSLIDRYELNAEQQANKDHDSATSRETEKNLEDRLVSGVPLVAMASKRPSSRGQSSSGVSSFSGSRVPEVGHESPGSRSTKSSSKGSIGTLHTDF